MREPETAAAGTLRSPETLYKNVTMGAVSRVGRLLPATKGEVQDVKVKFEAYRNETTAVINALVSEINSLTPVGSLLWHVCFFGAACKQRH